MKGYLITNDDGRKMISLVGSQSKTTISYSRYLMSVKLGYLVPDDLEVDHKDDDKTNDDINNLQLLTKQDNILKENYRYVMTEQECFGYHCAYCETAFILTKRQVNMRMKQSKSGLAFCSTECARVLQENRSECIGKTISESDIVKIKQLKSEGLSSYKISEITGFSRNTVMKYW